MPKLTDLLVHSLLLSKDRVEIWDTLLPSFGVRVGARRKSFQVINREGHRRKLGLYPNISLAQVVDPLRKAIGRELSADADVVRRLAPPVDLWTARSARHTQRRRQARAA